MRVLVTFAVEAEFAPWRKLRRFKRSGRRDVSFYEAEFSDRKVEVLLTGIGRAACERAFANISLSQAGELDFVISSGLAGALKNGLNPGDLVAAKKARTLRNDASAEADPALLEFAVRQEALPIETLITVDRLVQTANEKARLAFFGEAVDMESAIVMAHFAVAKIPVLAVRAISDGPDEDLPIDFDRCITPQGAIKPMSLVNAIVRNPSGLPNLVRFGRQSNQAAQKLAVYLDALVAALPVVQERMSAT
jgi:adenosylhomocysteine nucleosidase